MNNAIALGARGPNIRPARNRAAAMEGRNAMMQGQFQQMQMGQAMQEAERATQMRNALAGIDPNAADYYQQAASAAQNIDPTVAAGFVDKGVARDKSRMDSQAKKFEMLGQKVKLTGQILGSATSAQDFQMRVAQGVQAGILSPQQGQSFLSEPWTPELSRDLAMQGMKADERLRLMMEDDRFTYQQSKDAKDFDYRRGQDAQANRRADEQLEISRNTASATSANNDLKRQELELKIDEKESELAQKEKDKQSGELLMSEAYQLADNLLTDNLSGIKAAAGPVGSRLPSFRESTANAESDLERLATILTKDNLGLMTGILTDKDIQFLGRIAAGGLNLKQGDKKVIFELEKIRDKLQQYAGDETPQPAETTSTGSGRNRRETQAVKPGSVIYYDNRGNEL